MTVRAVGTAFNVWFDADKIEVLVTEGKVSVTAPRLGSAPANTGGDLNLSAGERAIIPIREDHTPVGGPAVAPMPADDAERALAWREMRLEFASTRLSEVVAQFNRYNQHKLFIDPAATELGELRFGGNFRPDAHEAFVRLLETNFGVQAERRRSETILRKAQ